MHFLMIWFSHVEDLLLTLGWWIFLGLFLCALVHWLIPPSLKIRTGFISVWLGLLIGSLMPICNCGVIPLVISFKRRGWCSSAVAAFYLAAALINPASILASLGLLGSELTTIYLLTSLIITLAAAYVVERCESDKKPELIAAFSLSESFLWSFRELGSVMAMWCLLGILIQGLVMTIFPASLFQSLLSLPEKAAPLQVVLMGISRYACIPDDVPFVASLSAAGMAPSCTVLLLIVGIVSNIPELVILLGMIGRKVTGIIIMTVLLLGSVAAFMIHLLIDEGFIPLLDLSSSDVYLKAANILTLGSWRPAASVCALLLLVLGGYGLYRQITQAVH